MSPFSRPYVSVQGNRAASLSCESTISRRTTSDFCVSRLDGTVTPKLDDLSPCQGLVKVIKGLDEVGDCYC